MEYANEQSPRRHAVAEVPGAAIGSFNLADMIKTPNDSSILARRLLEIRDRRMTSEAIEERIRSLRIRLLGIPPATGGLSPANPKPSVQTVIEDIAYETQMLEESQNRISIELNQLEEL
jgi:hypothetical protein